MILKIKHKIGKDKGMTVLETMMSMFILLMVTSVVAAGIPAATNAYSRVLDSANAQLLLSTAMTTLRDQLEMADEIVVDGTTITFETNNNGKSRIYLNADSGYVDPDNPGNGEYGHLNAVRLWEYIENDSEDEKKNAITKKNNRLLVSKKASNDNLYLTYSSVSYTEGSKYITIEGLAVKKMDTDQELAGPLDYSVKLLRKY